MSTTNKVFFGLIILFAIAAIMMTASELKIQQEWRSAIRKKEDEIRKVEAEIQKMRKSAKPTESIAGLAPSDLTGDELAVKVDLLMRDRNRAWFDCKPSDVKLKSKDVNPTLEKKEGYTPLKLTQITIKTLAPLDDRGVVYVFDEGTLGNSDEPNYRAGAFLGRFSIDGKPRANGDNRFVSSLTAIDPFTGEEETRIQNAKDHSWAIYASMPTDRITELYNPEAGELKDQPNLFAHLKPEYLSTIPELLQATLQGIDDSTEDGLRVRQNFEYLIAGAYQQRILLRQTIDTLKRNITELNDAKTKLDAEIKKSYGDQELETERIEAMNKQYDSVKTLYDEVVSITEQMEEEIDILQKSNEDYVQEIEKIHHAAAQSLGIEEKR